MILRITSTRPTPEERKALALREKKKEAAEIAYARAGAALKEAHAVYARTRREYKRALNDLVTYREKLEGKAG